MDPARTRIQTTRSTATLTRTLPAIISFIPLGPRGDRDTTTDLDNFLYFIFDGVTLKLANDYEFEGRNSTAIPDGLFTPAKSS